MDPHPRIGALEVWLGRAVGDALAEAVAIAEPAGMSPGWFGMLQTWGVRALSPDARGQSARVTGATRGAPVEEVYELLDSLQNTTDEHLNQIEWPDDGPGQRRWERLRSRVGDTRDKAVAWYRKQVVPARTGGMFGHAMAAANRGNNVQQATAKAQPFMHRCHNCGAPRMDEHGLDCEFCGHHFGSDKYGNKHGD